MGFAGREDEGWACLRHSGMNESCRGVRGWSKVDQGRTEHAELWSSPVVSAVHGAIKEDLGCKGKRLNLSPQLLNHRGGGKQHESYFCKSHRALLSRKRPIRKERRAGGTGKGSGSHHPCLRPPPKRTRVNGLAGDGVCICFPVLFPQAYVSIGYFN